MFPIFLSNINCLPSCEGGERLSGGFFAADLDNTPSEGRRDGLTSMVEIPGSDYIQSQMEFKAASIHC